MSRPKKQPRVLARQPRGFPDRSPADIRATEAMVARIREVYELYGFDPVETPMFEYTDALGKFLPDQDRPNEGVFSLQDDDEQWMSLRYDLTAPLARHVAQNVNEITLPYRTYRAGWVFRNEKPGPGRFRQFMQFDADTVGAPGPAADAEMCMMMADTMEALGVERGDYVVRVSDRRVVDGVMESIGLGGERNAGIRLGVLRALDKLDRLGSDAVLELLTDGRTDESGDFSEGLHLSSSQVRVLTRLLSKDRPDMVLGEVTASDGVAPKLPQPKERINWWNLDWWRHDTIFFIEENGDEVSDLVYEGFNYLSDIERQLWNAGISVDRIRLDLTCVRGLEYYTGAVYECELTFPVTNERGETVTFGSVAGGGRYDGLVKRFTGQDVPATGFSIGVSRLQTALKNRGLLPDDDVMAPVLVTVMDRDAEALASYQRMVQTLRGEGIRAEMYQGNPKQFGKQLQYADRRGCPVAVIQGSDERAAGEVQVKDLDEGKRLSAEIADNQAWRAARPAQVTCKVEDLIPTVRSMLQAQREARGIVDGPA